MEVPAGANHPIGRGEVEKADTKYEQQSRENRAVAARIMDFGLRNTEVSDNY
jgi:hypothetical protein